MQSIDPQPYAVPDGVDGKLHICRIVSVLEGAKPNGGFSNRGRGRTW
jgi:hypothetical protein